jgi:hypothetical protein
MDSTIETNNENIFNIEDLAIVYYSNTEPSGTTLNKLPTLDPFHIPANKDFIEALAHLNIECDQIMANVATLHSQLVSYLNTLDIKINLIAERLLIPSQYQQQAAQKILLSQRSLTFGTKELLKHNDLVCVKFILRPGYQIFNLLARVIDSHPHTESKAADLNFEFWTQVAFESMNQTLDQRLAKYLLHKQAEILRLARQ